MYNTVELVKFTGLSATPASFTLRGGQYGVTTHATAWGSMTLQRLAADGASWVTCFTLMTSDTFQSLSLPSGTYQMALSGVTGGCFDITSIVTAM